MPASDGRVKVQAIITDGEHDAHVDSAGAQITIDTYHHELHEGEAFGVEHVYSGVVDAANADMRLTTGDMQPHILFEVATSGKAEVKFYQDAVLGTGTAQTVNNRDLAKANLTGVTCGVSPTVTSVGNLIFDEVLPGGTKNASVGGSTSTRDEWMLKANTVYLIRVVNKAGSANDISIGASGYIQ